MPHVRVPAYAKINLTLEVLGQRPDGFHDIATVFQTIDLCDWLDIDVEAAPLSSVEVTASIPIPGENIAARAARAILEATRHTARVRIHIEKHIPLGGGLGGSSTDGSAVLAALPGLLGESLPLATLENIGATLGSDVNFFLHGGACSAFGRGEVLTPLPVSLADHGLLIAPGFPVSTPDAYRALARALRPPTQAERDRFAHLVHRITHEPLSSWAPSCVNDFESVVFPQHPALAALHSSLAATQPLLARMSGSGSSLFALYSSPPPPFPGAIPFRTLP